MANSDAQPPVHDEIHAIPPEGATDKERAGSPPNALPTPEIPPTPAHDRERHYCRPDQTPLWKYTLEYVAAVCGIALVIITAYYTRAAYRQAVASETAANAAKSAAETASQTLQQMKDSSKSVSEASLSAFKMEQRAYIAVTNYAPSGDPVLVDPNGSKHYCIDVHLSDGGRTPAIGTWTTRKVAFGKDGESIVKKFVVPPYPPSVGDVAGPGSDKWVTACSEAVDAKTMDELVHQQIDTYVYGVIQYKDIFGDSHQTGFCGDRGRGFIPFANCKFGNWFDERKRNH